MPVLLNPYSTVVLPAPFRVSQWVSGAVHAQHSLDSWGDATAIAAGKVLLRNSTDAEVQHIMGFGPITPSVDSTHRDYVASGLYDRLEDVMAGAGTKVIVFALAPAWMREVPAGVTPIDDFSPQAWFHAPPHADHVADFASLCANIAATFTEVNHFIVWNEMKGMFLDGSLRWDYERYTTLYNAVYAAVKAARPSCLIGGPYINLGSNIGPGSPVQGPEWGWVDQRLIDVMTYWLNHKTGADFIAVDGGNYPAGDVTTAVEFGKYRDFMAWLRALNGTTYPGAPTLPVWIAEHYNYPPGASTAVSSGDVPRYPAEWAVGTIEAIKAGYADCFLWQPQGDSGDPTYGFSYPLGLFTDTLVGGGGAATVLHPVVKDFHDNYQYPAPVWFPDPGNANIRGIGSATKCTLINRAGTSQSTSGFTPAKTLTAYQVLTFDWTPLGYTPATEVDYGALWQDTFATTDNLSVYRGSVTAVSGKLRGGTTSVANMAAPGSEYDNPDHYAQVVVSTLTGGSSEVGVALRFNTATGFYYLALVNGSGAGEIYYYDGAYHILNSVAGLTVSGLPKTLRGEVQGTALRLYWNGSLVVSTTDATLTTGVPTTYEYPTSAVANVEIDSYEADLL